MKKLDETQQRAIELLLERKIKRREYQDIADELGVHRNTLLSWRKDPLFQAEYKRAVVTNSHDRLDELVTAMLDNAISEGNAAMAKLVLQMNGMLTDKLEVENKGADNTQTSDIDAMKAEIARMRAARNTL
ncbi:transposase-like protein [Pullulanibacillus pueri]|uniref:Homeodomain phBC6A51-type domain-containing protein n=1 Tax=Pullulanibacillus pueri TaxID=1437324 RepID=A0A8J3EN02_9BACL|nr:phBC6A51 family helix-turn-helix protein [Pullulanibacillus pueri]MBM7683722.1 transposase-like protein [Pullulanibacillus pueri]GGH85162.1 hypothetical protein GCM10007096_29910 [Pullulanibacillus pueri]